MTSIIRDANRIPAMFGVSSIDGITPTPIKVNPSTGAMLLDKTSLGALGGGGLFARPATFVVAASNSNDTKNADYICTGTSDQSTINTAISALPAAGGTIILLDGTYTITGNINIGGGYIRIIGQGWGTILSVSNSTNADIFNFTPAGGNYCDGCEISNLKVLANGANQTSGNVIGGTGIVWCKFERLWIDTPWGNGIYLHGDNLGAYGHHNVIVHNKFTNGQNSNGGDGRAILLDTSDENMVTNNEFQDNGRAAASEPNHIYDKAGLNTFINNQFVGGQTGIKLQGPHSKAIGNTFDGCKNHEMRLNGNEQLVVGNMFYNIGNSMTSNTGDGLWVDNVSYCIIANNIFLPMNNGNGCRSGVNLSSGPATNITVIGNTFTTDGQGTGTFGTNPIIVSTGSGHIINNNNGVTVVSTKTATYTVNLLDQLIRADATSAGFTITLPTATGNAEFQVMIKKIDSTGNIVTIATSGGQTIDGASTATISVQYISLTFMSDGTNWNLI